MSAASAAFCVDNGAFTAWRQGNTITDWQPYYAWVKEWARCPRFDFAIIPDVIEGSEEENDELIVEWRAECQDIEAAPVWHMHESLERLETMINEWNRVCIGSSGKFSKVGSLAWHERMCSAMDRICDEAGRPRVKIHGLRMLAPAIVERYPLASADSTNVAQNSQLLGRFGGYAPPTQAQRREVIASRIEATISASVWESQAQQEFTLSAD